MSESEAEVWNDVLGLPYQVSSLARVRRSIPYRNSTIDGVLKQLHDQKTGYFFVCLCHQNKKLRRSVHSLVAAAFHGPRPSRKHVVAHGDGSRKNNRPSNLRWATYQENEADKLKHGTRCRGEKQHLSKLTEEKVREIRASPMSVRALADKYGMDKSSIYDIRGGLTWKHVA